jgi:hypothetical protein
MSLGYNRPLYLLPFDHRHSYVTDMFSFMPPLTADEHEAVAASKQVIYDGFRQTLDADPDIVVQLFAGHMTSITVGFDVLVHEVMAAITTSPCVSSTVAGRAGGVLDWPSRFGVGRLFIISVSVSVLVLFARPSGMVSSDLAAARDQR